MCSSYCAQDIDLTKAGMTVQPSQRTIVFVLGGPGSGKGTQVCTQVSIIRHLCQSRMCTALHYLT